MAESGRCPESPLWLEDELSINLLLIIGNPVRIPTSIMGSDLVRVLRNSLIAVTLLGGSAAASAQTFSGTGTPGSDATFTGPVQVATFTGANQSFATYTESGITIGPGSISSNYANDYNTTGSSYDNNAGYVPVISFAFASATSAFAFNWGAADNNWIVDLFSGATNIGTYTLLPTFGSNNQEYFGFTGTNITNVTLTNTSEYDFVFIDNLTYGAAAVAAVPEPATWAMMLLGFGAMGISMRRRRRTHNLLQAA